MRNSFVVVFFFILVLFITGFQRASASPTLSATVATDKQAYEKYPNPETVNISGYVKDSDQPVYGAVVSFKAGQLVPLKVGANTIYFTRDVYDGLCTTNTAGFFSDNSQLSGYDAEGAWAVNITASKMGYNDATASTPFNVFSALHPLPQTQNIWLIVSTENPRYRPGEIVIISGKFDRWVKDITVSERVTDPSGRTIHTALLHSDQNGWYSDTFTLQTTALWGNYTVSATISTPGYAGIGKAYFLVEGPPTLIDFFLLRTLIVLAALVAVLNVLVFMMSRQIIVRNKS